MASPAATLALLLAPALALLVAAGFLSAAAPGASAAGQTEGLAIWWSQFQGGPAHLGASEGSSVEPPLEEVWRFDDPNSESGLSGPILAGDLAIAVGVNRVWGLDLATGQEALSLEREEGRLADPAVGEADGRTVLVYTQGADDQTEAVAIDLSTQEGLWTAEIGALSRSGVTVDGDRAYLGDGDGVLHALDLATGEPLWTHEGIGEVNSAVAAGEGLVVAVFGDASERAAEVVAVERETGEVAWVYDPQLVSPLSSAPVVAEGNVFVGFAGGVRAVASEDGEEVWASRTRGFFSTFSAGAFSGGSLYAADIAAGLIPSSGLYRLDGGTGDRVWDYQFRTPVIRGSPVVLGDTVVVGLDDGRLAAVETLSGHQVWEGETGAGALGAIAVGPDILVVRKGGDDGGLVAFRSDPDVPRTDIPSPTELDLLGVLQDFGLAFAAVFGVLFVLFRYLLRPMLPPPLATLRVGAAAEATVTEEPGDEEGGPP